MRAPEKVKRKKKAPVTVEDALRRELARLRLLHRRAESMHDFLRVTLEILEAEAEKLRSQLP